MWITKDVDLPSALVSAQRGGNLVVFAGAGVSIGAPSSLPDFETLANLVGGGTAARRDQERVDDYLGRVEGLGAHVQRLTREIIGNPESRCRQIHRDIVGLFARAESLRLITTNFDPHFSVAARERFADGYETYFAPALPLGRDFCGIAYIHGSVQKTRARLVLTDRDFGRAYLTDGWATRMLVEVFENFTVLFVGYSHEDPVMRYLARSLSGRIERFALSLPGQEEKWASLGITPVHFPPRGGDDRFSSLNEAVGAWAALSRMGVLEHEAQITRIAGEAVGETADTLVLEKEVQAYMVAALGDLATLRFFTKSARNPAWLHWMVSTGELKDLFSRTCPVEERTSVLSSWFAESFALEYPVDALGVVAEHGGRLSLPLWHAIAWNLGNRDPRVQPELFRKWVGVLTVNADESYNLHVLTNVLTKCSTDEDVIAAKMLFRYLIQPVVRVEKPWSSSDETRVNVRFGLTVRGDTYQLKQAWQTFFRPRLATVGRSLRPMLEESLRAAHGFTMVETDGGFDPLSFRRSAIEPHSQDQFHEPIDFIIDCLREILDHELILRPDESKRWILDDLGQDVPLLARLALYGLAKSAAVEPDEKLAIVREQRLLFAPNVKHEVFAVLKGSFATATDSAQALFIQHIESGGVLDGEQDDPELKRIVDYERFNVAAWLGDAAPGSSVAQTFWTDMQAKHPEFGKREHPDFDHWSSGARWVTNSSPYSPEQLLAMTPEDAVDKVLTWKEPESNFDGPNRRGLLDAVRSAVTQKPESGILLGRTLAARAEWERIWPEILGAWKQAQLDRRVLTEIIPLLSSWSISRVHVRELSDLAEQIADSPVDLTEDEIEALEGVVMGGLVGEGEDGISPLGARDWLAVAINHPGGRAALALLRLLSRRNREAGDAGVGLPATYREAFTRVVGSPSASASRARIVLASQLHFMFAQEPTWTKEFLVPLFDWRRDEERAEQSWHGYLGWGRWNDAIVAELRPFLADTFTKLGTSLAQLDHALTERFAGVALYSASDPWQGGWLPDFITNATPKSRELFAGSVSRELSNLDEEAVKSVWTKWMSVYWRARLTGVPRPLVPGEQEEMAQWPLALVPVFREAVDLVCQAPVALSEHSMFLYVLHDHPTVRSHPQDVARLLRHVLATNRLPLYQAGYALTTLAELRKNGVATAELTPLAERLVELGGDSAAVLSAIA